MREMIRLLVVIAVFSAVSGGLLAAIQSGTKERIEYQQLKFVKGPTIQQILEGCSNDPLVDRFKLSDGKEERNFFVGVFKGSANTVFFIDDRKNPAGINVVDVFALAPEFDKRAYQRELAVGGSNGR